MYTLPLPSTVVKTETNGGKALVWGAAEDSLPVVLRVPPFTLRLDKFVSIVHSERKRRMST